MTAGEKMELAFFQLIEEKHYSKITVSELIEKAGVSRTTFYRHYVDIFDMYRKTCDRLIEAFVSVVFLSMGEPKDADALSAFYRFSEMLESQGKYVMLLCGKNGGRYFFESVMQTVFNLKDMLISSYTQAELFKLKFAACAGIGSYVKTMIDGSNIDPEFMILSRDILNISELSEEKTNG